jgi:hypothetical protein
MISSIKEYNYINEMVQLVYLDKRDIIKFIDKETIDKFNINYFFRDNRIIRLSETIDNNEIFRNKIFNTLYHVNYFKQNLNLILKYIIYAEILKKERVFENKTTLQKNRIDTYYLFNKLKIYKLINIIDLIKDIII